MQTSPFSVQDYSNRHSSGQKPEISSHTAPEGDIFLRTGRSQCLLRLP